MDFNEKDLLNRLRLKKEEESINNFSEMIDKSPAITDLGRDYVEDPFELEDLYASKNIEELEEVNEDSKDPNKETKEERQASIIQQEAKNPFLKKQDVQELISRPALVKPDFTSNLSRDLASDPGAGKVLTEKTPLTRKEKYDEDFIRRLEEIDRLRKKDIREARDKDYLGNLLGNAISFIGRNLGGGELASLGLANNVPQFKYQDMSNRAEGVEKDYNASLKSLMNKYNMLMKKDPDKLTAKEQRDLANTERNLDLLEKQQKGKEFDPLKQQEQILKIKKLEKELGQPKKSEIDTFKEKEQFKKDLQQIEPIQKQLDNSTASKIQFQDALDTYLNFLDQPFSAGTGPIVGKGPIGWVRSFGDDYNKIQQTFSDLSLDTMIKKFQGMSRAIDTEADRMKFDKTQADVGNDEEVNVNVLLKGKALTDMVNILNKAKLKHFNEGKPLSEFQDPLEGRRPVVDANGNTVLVKSKRYNDDDFLRKHGLFRRDDYAKILAQDPNTRQRILNQYRK